MRFSPSWQGGDNRAQLTSWTRNRKKDEGTGLGITFIDILQKTHFLISTPPPELIYNFFK